MRAAALLILLATASAAETPESFIAQAGGDTLEFRDSEDGTHYELFYSNSGGETSHRGTYRLSHDGVTISVRVDVGRAETITIDVPEGLMAIPDRMDVPDGETFTFRIMRPMF